MQFPEQFWDSKETLSECRLFHGIENLLSNLYDSLGSRWFFAASEKHSLQWGSDGEIGSFHLSRKYDPYLLHLLYLALSCYYTLKPHYWHAKDVVLWLRHISLPLIAFRPQPRTLSCVCATANVCLRAKECKPPLLISPLRRSHRAEEWEAVEKKKRRE